MRTVAVPGRWFWGASGLITVALLAVPAAWLVTSAGIPRQHGVEPHQGLVRKVTVAQPVTGLDVESYGGPVQVSAGRVPHVQVTETIAYGPGQAGPPAVTESVSRGRLTLADPACAVLDCAVSFAVTVPAHVAVTVTSEGGPVEAAGIGGPLTVTTGGGPLLAQEIRAATVKAVTDGGQAWIGFSAPPDAVMVSTGGGPASLTVPGGPYALTADSGGGPELVGIATDPAARRSIAITSGGGELWIGPAGCQSGAAPASRCLPFPKEPGPVPANPLPATAPLPFGPQLSSSAPRPDGLPLPAGRTGCRYRAAASCTVA